jgi:Putative zinc-finger
MSVQHTDVASYALGLLEEEDRQGFEAHLAECASCTAELAEFSAMADLFTGVEPVEVIQEGPPAEAAIAGLIAARAAARRRGVRRQVILAVAASVVLLAGGVTAGIAAAPPQTPQVGQPIPGQRVSATDPGTGVTATVGLVSKAWGTQITLDLAKVRGPLECQLVAVSSTGERRVVTGWFVPSPGDGIPGHPGHLVIHGGTAIPEKQLASLAVIVVHGNTLVNIPVR